jgi:phage gpG-like protein
MENRIQIEHMANGFQTMKRTLPLRLANICRAYFVKSFENQAWDGKKWKSRKAIKKKGRNSAILVKTGKLRRAVNNSIRSYNMQEIRLGVNLPYAKIHNEGFKGNEVVRPFKRVSSRNVRIKGSYSGLGDEKGKGRKVKMPGARYNVRGFNRKMNMPQRQFMGPTDELKKLITEEIRKDLIGILKIK